MKQFSDLAVFSCFSEVVKAKSALNPVSSRPFYVVYGHHTFFMILPVTKEETSVVNLTCNVKPLECQGTALYISWSSIKEPSPEIIFENENNRNPSNQQVINIILEHANTASSNV